MTRDRVETERRLIDAVHELVTEGGFDQVRINKVAQRAKVNKILIYRYFGGLSGLINAYFDKYQPVVSAPLIDLEKLEGVSVDEFIKACTDFVITEFRLLRNNPQAQKFLRNDLVNNQSGVLNQVAFQKEERLRKMIDKLSSLVQSDYGRAFAAIIASGMTLLTFMAHDKRQIMGIDVSTDEGWGEIERAVQRIFYDIGLGMKERLGSGNVPTDSPSSDGQEPL